MNKKYKSYKKQWFTGTALPLDTRACFLLELASLPLFRRLRLDKMRLNGFSLFKPEMKQTFRILTEYVQNLGRGRYTQPMFKYSTTQTPRTTQSDETSGRVTEVVEYQIVLKYVNYRDFKCVNDQMMILLV